MRLLALSIANWTVPSAAQDPSADGDSVFALLALMAAIALTTGVLEFFQLRGRKGFPIPFILYCHLVPMIGFIYAGLAYSNDEATVSYWPLYIAMAPLPFVLAGRVRSLFGRSAEPQAGS